MQDEMSTAWPERYDILRRVPNLVKKLGREDDPRIQAERYRYLARLDNMADMASNTSVSFELLEMRGHALRRRAMRRIGKTSCVFRSADTKHSDK